MSEKWINHLKFQPKFEMFKPLSFYKKNYAILPILFLVACDIAWMSFCTVQGFIRTNVILTRNTPTQGELTDLLIHPRNRKFYTYAQTFPIQQDLYNTYEEMRCEKERREEECKRK